MPRFARPRVAVALLSLWLFAGAFPAEAADHFLVIGGGNGPDNNQVSLEKNVLFFRRLLAESAEPGAPADVLFASGSDGAANVQFLPAQDPPRLNQLLARLFGQEQGLWDEYRPHLLGKVRGPATRAALDDWFNAAANTLGAGDRVIIYFTGHGGPGSNPPQNTNMSLWCQPPMTVTEFTRRLDRLSPKVSVVLWMVQCHAGGFAGTIFKEGKAGGELSASRRCGFFATRFDRNAAGCTPDTVEDDYKDYSTYFFGALGGKSRGGDAIGGCDLDGDGRVSFAEANAYVQLHSDTIDIPTTTSEALLRRFSKTSGAGLATPQMPFSSLIEHASVVHRTVLLGLCDQLKLASDDRFNEARRAADLEEGQRRSLSSQRRAKEDEAQRLNDQIKSRLLQKWPDIGNPWRPQTQALLRTHAAEIQQAIELDSDCPRWELLRRDIDQLDDQELAAERRWVKYQRLIRALETTALAQNLEKVASPQVLTRYREMVEDEAGTLAPP